ncbi:hypothetical protein P43SY_008366 [Pythium insidiosum]|uniref:Uncharacterized protein n=1 Tax=Pythium insidiosum TaxID=114742 RepID=A0AAD5Q977_PYTIN|nr:hypothetical protein P43SY_008366 [Pythium insidiosum]
MGKKQNKQQAQQQAPQQQQQQQQKAPEKKGQQQQHQKQAAPAPAPAKEAPAQDKKGGKKGGKNYTMASHLTRTLHVMLLAAVLLQSSVHAHGELHLPRPTYPKWGGNVAATISVSVMPFQRISNYTKAFDEAIRQTGLSLKEFILKHQDMSGASVDGSTPECGYSDPNGRPQPLPERIKFDNNGFIHQGPCEAYCDDVLVTRHTPDCRSAYPGGLVPYDRAKCEGKKRFTFYWLTMDALDSAPWQVYTNCVPLLGSSHSNETTTLVPQSTRPTTQPSLAPTETPVMPSILPPRSTAPAPTSSPPKPKCNRRQRRV